MTGDYSHGHAESVLRSHSWRTVANSAAYLLPHLRPGLDVLDVGCGPGTITVDLASYVAPGRVLGIENVAAPLEAARQNARDAGVDVGFERADVMDLELGGRTYDVVHAHQVLQHLTDPVEALRQMRRVCRPGGLVAARDSDYAAMTWFPELPGLARWLEVYRHNARLNGAEPDAGRKLLAWAREAGFTDVTPSASVWCFATREDRAWWGGTWATRVTDSAFADQTTARGLVTRSELSDIAGDWQRWAESEDGWFAVLHGEVLCRG